MSEPAAIKRFTAIMKAVAGRDGLAITNITIGASSVTFTAKKVGRPTVQGAVSIREIEMNSGSDRSLMSMAQHRFDNACMTANRGFHHG